MSLSSKFNFNTVMAILFIAFGAILFIIIPYEIEHPFVVIGMVPTDLSPELFPRIIAVSMFLLGIWYLILSPRIQQTNDLTKLNREAITNVVATLLFMSAYIFLMTELGFVVGSFIMVFAMSTYFGNRNWIAGFLVSLLVPMAIFHLFVGVLHSQLPPFPMDIPILSNLSII